MQLTEAMTGLMPDQVRVLLNEVDVSVQLIVVVVVIAFNWCLMKILLSLFDRSKTETNLRNICCKAQRQIYYFEAEKDQMRADIDSQRQRAELAEKRLRSAEEQVIPLEKSLAKLKTERNQLQHKVQSLESELEDASEAAIAANRLLNDFLTSQKENVDLSSSVDSLQQQISKQAEVVTRYEEMAKQKEAENEQLKEILRRSTAESDRVNQLLKQCEHNLEIIRSNNEQLKTSKSDLLLKLNNLNEEYSDLKIRNDELIERNDKLSDHIQEMLSDIDLLRDQNSNKDLEIETLRNILEKIRKFEKISVNRSEDEGTDRIDQTDSNDITLSDMFDVVKMELQIKNLIKDKNELVSKLEELNEQYKEVGQRLVDLEDNNLTLESEKESVLQDKMKVQVELEVMKKYYKERELQFGIEIQQVQRQHNEEDSNSMANRLTAIEEENTSLRDQLKALKKDIANKERNYKSQINHLEKQVHENWILARNAERKLDEAKAEASVLRQTLTLSVKSPVDGFNADSFLDDSSSSVSDQYQFSGFLPPPPPPPLPPPPPIFGAVMPPMLLPYNENNKLTGLRNPIQSEPRIAQELHSTSMFNPIQTDIPMGGDPIDSYSSLDYAQPMSQWDSSVDRGTQSPASQLINNYGHSGANNYYINQNKAVDTDLINNYQMPPMTTPSAEPLHSGQYHQLYNGTNSNDNQYNEYNESNSSRPQSRSRHLNDISLQTSNV